MWIKRELFERLLTEKAKAEGQATILAQRIVAQDTTVGWLTVRLTQLEYERAQLIHNYMGVKLPVLEIGKDIPAERSVLSVEQVLNQTISFDDIGDDAAKAQGLDWDHEGRLVKDGKLVQ